MNVLEYSVCRDPITGEEWIETDLRGKRLLTTVFLNKGTAYTEEERRTLGLLGKLPHKIDTLEEQVKRAYRQYKKYRSDLQRHIYLNNMHDKNEVLFYQLINTHLEEMIPIIYTPTIGQAVKEYSTEFRQPRGLYLSIEDQDQLEELLDNRTNADIRIVVVTDGERVLGIGDQGVGAMGIPIAKLALYTACGGINPYHTLPIMLDVGTDNQTLLEDPLYLGCRHPRIRDERYDSFIDKFVKAIKKKLPLTLLHWEDFGRNNARRILEKYRHELCTFNDDMQGMAVVTTAALLTAVSKIQSHLKNQRIVVFGAGTAGVGIADGLVNAMIREGLSKREAVERVWLVDKQGLLSKDMPDLTPFQKPYERAEGGGNTLEKVVKDAKATVLIGCSSVAKAFNKNIVKTMMQFTETPIIFPLSNPNELSEAEPHDLLEWTQGKAMVATGSPFGSDITQCNNAFAFPGIGLGAVASRAKRITDDMLWAATETLSKAMQNKKSYGSLDSFLLPKLSEAMDVAIQIGIAVAEQACKEGVARIPEGSSCEALIKEITWRPYYRNIRPRGK